MTKRIFVFVIVLMLVTLGVLNYIKNPRPYKIAWANLIYGNKEHYLACEDLPFYVQAEKAVSGHQDAVTRVKGIKGVKDLTIEEVKCYTFDKSTYFKKGDILVTDSGRGPRKEVEKTIGKDFFGIPYRVVAEK